MRGRKPLPTSLKQLRGNPGKRPINGQEPRPKTERTSCPAELCPLAKKEWRRIVPILEELQLIGKIDRAAIAGYCQSYGRWMEAEQKISETSLVIKTKSGNVIESPYYSIAKRERELMHKFLVEFGMTPSARTRLKVPEKPTPNPFRELAESFNRH
jgi:P27 family predicted phage terminase small subunit